MNLLEQVNKAILLAKQGKNAAAEKLYLELLERYPDDIRILPFLGWFYISTSQYNKAVNIFEKINRSTKNINVITGLGLAYYHTNRFKEAYENLKIAADANPAFDILEKLITCACEKTNHPETVFEYAKKMKSLYPDSPKTWECYILAALCAGHFEDAENYCAELLKNNPNSPELYLSAGLIQEVLYSNYNLALECYLKAVNISHSPAALYNAGLIYSRLKNYKEAEKYLLEAYKTNTDSPSLNTTLYLLYMKMKQFKKGYSYFKKSALEYGAGKMLKNLWNGKSAINETLYVYGDQGFGDIIMYSRYLSCLRDKFKKVILALPQTLIPLYTEVLPKNFFKIVSLNTSVKYDKSILISFLPYYLNLDFFENIPYSDGYIKLNKNIINTELIPRNDKKLKAGIVWEAAGTALRGPIDRTVNIKLLSNILNIKEIDFYSLQVNPSMNGFSIYPQLKDLGNTFNNFLNTAVAIENLDIIISVDTSVAHLAGAMGKKVLIMLPYASDWRWFDTKGSTSWYKSAEIFSQKTPGDWFSVITDVEERLRQFLTLRQ